MSTAFPVGTWTFTTALKDTSTACTSNGDAISGYSHYSYGPPPYSQAGSDETAPDRYSLPQKEGIIKDNEWFQRRGGWKRLAVMAVVLIALIVGLGVGLTIGLRNRYAPIPLCAHDVVKGHN